MTYRLWPLAGGANPQIIPDAYTTMDGASDGYAVATEIRLSEQCALDRIWYWAPPYFAGESFTDLATECDVWNIATGLKVASDASPAWVQPAGTGLTGFSLTTGTGYAQLGVPFASTSDATDYTAGNQFQVFASCQATAIRFYYASASTGLPVTAAIFDTSTGLVVPGTQINSPAWLNSSNAPASPGDGWVHATLTSPVALTASHTYVVAVQGPGAQVWYSESQDIDLPFYNGAVAITAYAFIAAATLTYPTTTGTSVAFGMDVEVTTLADAPVSHGGGWVYNDFAGVMLNAGSYRVSAYNSDGASAPSGGWNVKRLGYWGLYLTNPDPGAGGITSGPLYAPPQATASNCWEYNASDPTATPPYSDGTQVPGQSPFGQMPDNSLTFPQLYVSTLFQNYWIDMEVTPAAPPGGGAGLLLPDGETSALLRKRWLW